MAWMMDTLSRLDDRSGWAAVTGKPLGLGGSVGRAHATGNGVAIVSTVLLRELGQRPEATTVAVQGFGKVGRAAALALAAAGCRVVAVSDVSGGLYDRNGLDLAALAARVDPAGGLLTGYGAPGIEPIGNEELLELEVDLLVPAALEGQITGANARLVRARAVVEAANGPVTVAADRVLTERGVIVVPDILANAAGVVVSHLEWAQNLQGLVWDGEQVELLLRRRMVRAFEDVWATARDRGASLRSAAYLLAVERVAEAVRRRGFSP